MRKEIGLIWKTFSSGGGSELSPVGAFPLLIRISAFLHICSAFRVPSCILIRYRFINERLLYTVGIIGLPRLERSLLTLIGSCRIC